MTHNASDQAILIPNPYRSIITMACNEVATQWNGYTQSDPPKGDEFTHPGILTTEG